jgi:hypothetical protein
MAHPCIFCGSECYCHGDWDDVIVSKTPKGCESCGCEYDDEDDRLDDDDHYEDLYNHWEQLASTCRCGAWKFGQNGEVFHVADCVCGAE